MYLQSRHASSFQSNVDLHQLLHLLSAQASTAAMPFNSTLLYANTTSLTFNMPYYLTHHFPLVTAQWGPHGLLNWQVVQFTSTPGDSDNPNGSEPPYTVQAILTWRDKECFTAAMASKEWKSVFDDVPNFCNEMPLMMVGDVVGSS
jgi:uncharacterized protein (TIGR02118 family)